MAEESLLALVSLESMKRRLGEETTDHDQEIADLIASVSVAIEDYLQTAFVIRAITETHIPSDFQSAGWHRRLYLNRRPVVSIELITDPQGNELVEGTNYLLFDAYLEGFFPTPFDEHGHVAYWEVSYLAGRYVDTAAIAKDNGNWAVVEAAKMEVARRYGVGGSSSASSNITSKSVGELSISYGSPGSEELHGGLSAEVVGLLAPYAQFTI